MMLLTLTPILAALPSVVPESYKTSITHRRIVSQSNVVESLTHRWPQRWRPLRTDRAILFIRLNHSRHTPDKENPRSCMDKIEGKLSDYTLQADTIVPLTDRNISDDRSVECGASANSLSSDRVTRRHRRLSSKIGRRIGPTPPKPIHPTLPSRAREDALSLARPFSLVRS
jgi:hypothetical protein